jgi:hypothetical protein
VKLFSLVRESTAEAAKASAEASKLSAEAAKMSVANSSNNGMAEARFAKASAKRFESDSDHESNSWMDKKPVRNLDDGDGLIDSEVFYPITQGLAMAKSLENPSADHKYMLENLAIIEKEDPGFHEKLLRKLHQLSRPSNLIDDLAWTDLLALTGENCQNRPGMIFLEDQDSAIVIYNEVLFDRDILENVAPVLLPLLGFSDQHTVIFGKAQIVISWKDSADASIVANVVKGVLSNAIGKAEQESEDNEEEEKIVVEILGGVKSNTAKAKWILEMDALTSAISDNSECFLHCNSFVFTTHQQAHLLNVAGSIVLNHCELENGGKALVDAIFAAEGRLTELHLVGSLPFSADALERILMESHTKASSWVQLVFYSGAFSDLYEMEEFMEKLKVESSSTLFTSQMDRWRFCVGQNFSSDSFSSTEEQWLLAFTGEALGRALHKKKSKIPFDDLKMRIKKDLAEEDIAAIEAWPIEVEECTPHFVAMVSRRIENMSFVTATLDIGPGLHNVKVDAEVVGGNVEVVEEETTADSGNGSAGCPAVSKKSAPFNDTEAPLVDENRESIECETSQALDNAPPPLSGDENDAPLLRRGRRFKDTPEFGPLPGMCLFG